MHGSGAGDGRCDRAGESLVGVECCCPARVTLFSLLDLGAAERAGHCPCNTPRLADPLLGASTQEVLELSQKSLLKTA